MLATDVIRAGFGVALLAVPARLVSLTGAEADAGTVTAARVLGVRHVFQAAGSPRLARTKWRHAGAAIDGVHAGSMIALGLRDERHRSVCFANALTAAAPAVASLAETRQQL